MGENKVPTTKPVKNKGFFLLGQGDPEDLPVHPG